MNSAGKMAALLLLLGIAGCQHKVQSAAPPATPDRVYPPEVLANETPLPQPPPPEPATVKGPGSGMAQQTPPPKPAKKKSRKSRPSDSGEVPAAKETTPTSSATAPEAAAGQPPDTSPIGQLTSSSDSGSLTHQKILDLINRTERDLNEIKRTLTSDQQQTATQIRTFLTKAKKALDQDDLDGANTLVTKAKVLLDELPKE